MDRRSAILTVCTGSLLLGQKQKPPEIEVLEASAHVDAGRVIVDCRVKNVSDKPIRKLTLVLEVLDIEDRVLTKQQGTIDAPVLDPGEDSLFQAQLAYHARTHAWRVSFEDGSGRDLRAEQTGPFPIE